MKLSPLHVIPALLALVRTHPAAVVKIARRPGAARSVTNRSSAAALVAPGTPGCALDLLLKAPRATLPTPRPLE